MKNRAFHNLGFALPFTIAGFMGLTGNNSVFAQLTQDNTLGAESSTVTVEELRNLIRGGAIRGNALFHSFSEFNVGSDRGVFFDLQNNADILNIFTRVTGSNSSQILGTLGVLNDLGSANLFLLNPNGITFGENSRLQLNGSFFATTADSFDFDNFSFSASGGEAPPPLLTVSIPRFASFRDNPEDIAVNDNLEVESGQNITLLGGNVTLTDAEITASGGNVNLGGLTAAGNVQINPDGSLVFPEGVARGNITLTGNSEVNVVSGGGGNININAGDLVVDRNNNLTAGLQRNQGDADSQAGDININTTGDITVSGNIRNNSPRDSRNDNVPSGNAGNITIVGNNINVTRGSIESLVRGTGDGGDINITANGELNLTRGTIQTRVNRSDANGDAGNININANSITVGNRSAISSVTENEGTDTGGVGNGGNINISTDSLTITEGGDIIARTQRAGRGGNVTITATGAVELTNGGSTVIADGNDENNNDNDNIEITGDSGDINIRANSLLLESEIDANDGNQPFIITRHFGSGTPGKITINVNTLTLNGPNGGGPFGINAQTRSSGDSGGIEITTGTLQMNFRGKIQSNVNQSVATGNSGDIIINAESISLSSRSEISSSTRSEVDDPNQGNAGSIIITTNSLTISGTSSAIDTEVRNENTTGTGGNITITTNTFSLIDGGNLDASTAGIGDAGDISVTATESVIISGIDTNRRSSRITSGTEVNSTGAAGDINIQVPTGFLRIADGGIINVETRGEGDGGRITVNANSLELLTGGQIVSSTFTSGNAGSIDINASEEVLVSGFDTGFNERLEFAQDRVDDISDLITNDGSSSGIIARTLDAGNAGIINVTAPNLTIEDSAQITASTQGAGGGGNIKLTVDDTILIGGIGSGIFSTAESGSTGSAGNIIIDPQQVTIQDGGAISVNSEGLGIGGNINLTSDNLTLDNGSITAATSNTNGGNITLNITDLLRLSNESLISGTAGENGNGGNVRINLDGGFIVAFPPTGDLGSDILASAINGDGGDINITATGIFGIAESSQGRSNDINASSNTGISGTVTLNTPDTQINQEQVEPPEDVVDSSDIVSQSVCSDFGGDSQLANSGRGGVPQIPGFIIRNDVVDVDLVDEVLPAPPPEAIKPHHRTDVTFLDSEGEEFKPAMGAVLLPNGMVEFVDYNPAEVYRDMYAAAGCNRLSKE